MHLIQRSGQKGLRRTTRNAGWREQFMACSRWWPTTCGVRGSWLLRSPTMDLLTAQPLLPVSCNRPSCPRLPSILPWKRGRAMKYPLTRSQNVGMPKIKWAMHFLGLICKHCQRHNGPEGWVLLTKITSFVISKFLHKFWSNFISRISTKHQLQNLNQISAFRLNLNFKILTKPSFRISTKIKLHNLNQASAAKYWPKFSFKISPEL